MIAVWPVQSLKMALRLHHEVPGIEVPEDLIAAMEAAGPDAAKVGRERALTLFREAPKYADGVYLIAPFKKPENVIPLIDEATAANGAFFPISTVASDAPANLGTL